MTDTTPNFDLKSFQTTLPIPLITPDDPRYDSAREVFYGGFDLHPGAIVRPRTSEEVARVVTYSAEHGIELAVRSGGHSLAGYSGTEGGIVLDLADLDSIDIDPTRRTARAGAGLTTGEYTKAAAKYGLATGFGDTPSVGIGGITLSGGIGFLVRKHGLTIDNLMGAELVTADGRVLQVDEEHHPDLFWAIRGGGGNFGVVTSFQYRLQPVDRIVGGMIIFRGEPDLLTGFMTEAAAATDDLSTILTVAVAPPLPFIPESVHGELVAMAFVAHAGDLTDGEREMERLRRLGEPLADMLHPMHYPELFEAEGEGPPFKPRFAGHNLFLDGFDERDARHVIDSISRSNAMMSVVQLRALGGQMSRVPNDATAFAHRLRPVMANTAAMYMDPAEVEGNQAWVDETAGGFGATTDTSYVGFMGTESGGARRAYPEPTLSRLQEVKRRYDPNNVFSRNIDLFAG